MKMCDCDTGPVGSGNPLVLALLKSRVENMLDQIQMLQSMCSISPAVDQRPGETERRAEADAENARLAKIVSEIAREPWVPSPNKPVIESILRNDVESASSIEERSVAVRTLIEFANNRAVIK